MDPEKEHQQQLEAERSAENVPVDKGAADRTGSNDLEKPLPEEENAVPVKWTFTRVVAVIALCLVYVGL